jgi:hypothetical protein
MLLTVVINIDFMGLFVNPISLLRPKKAPVYGIFREAGAFGLWSDTLNIPAIAYAIWGKN